MTPTRKRKPYRGTWERYPCGHERSDANSVASGPSGYCCRICKLAYQKAYRERNSRLPEPPTFEAPPPVTTDEAIRLYRLEREKSRERHAPAKAALQARIEAAWQARREEDLAAQKGGRPRKVVGAAPRRETGR